MTDGLSLVRVMVDVYALTLLAISFTIFLKRFLKEEPPVAPYLVIALTCAAATVIGKNGGETGATVLLVAASFLFLACLLRHNGPMRLRGEAKPKTE